MDNSTHTSSLICILSGALLSVSSFFAEHGWILDNILELIKVISFGVIGGACGYIGRIIASRIHKHFIK